MKLIKDGVRVSIEILLGSGDQEKTETIVLIGRRFTESERLKILNSGRSLETKVTKAKESGEHEELEKNYLDGLSFAIEALVSVITKWEGVTGEDDQPIPYSEKNLRELCESIPDITPILLAGYMEACWARRKN